MRETVVQIGWDPKPSAGVFPSGTRPPRIHSSCPQRRPLLSLASKVRVHGSVEVWTRACSRTCSALGSVTWIGQASIYPHLLPLSATYCPILGHQGRVQWSEHLPPSWEITSEAGCHQGRGSQAGACTTWDRDAVLVSGSTTAAVPGFLSVMVPTLDAKSPRPPDRSMRGEPSVDAPARVLVLPCARVFMFAGEDRPTPG